MTDELKTNEMEWSEASDLHIKANIKAADAYRAWKDALSINTLGLSDQVAKEAYVKREEAYAEYKRCHDEAYRLSVISNSLYVDKVGTDDHLFNK